MTEIEKMIHEAIGEASMCWQPKPSTEVFDSTKASEIAKRLYAYMQSEIDRATHEGAKYATENMLAQKEQWQKEPSTNETVVYPAIPGARIRVISQDFAEVIIPYAQLIGLKEQWQKEGFLAAIEGDCDDEGRFTPDYITFEDWQKTQGEK